MSWNTRIFRRTSKRPEIFGRLDVRLNVLKFQEAIFTFPRTFRRKIIFERLKKITSKMIQKLYFGWRNTIVFVVKKHSFLTNCQSWGGGSPKSVCQQKMSAKLRRQKKFTGLFGNFSQTSDPCSWMQHLASQRLSHWKRPCASRPSPGQSSCPNLLMPPSWFLWLNWYLVSQPWNNSK